MAEIDSAELTEWKAYYGIEPFGEQVADARHGSLTSTLANCNRDPKRKPEPYRPSDFIPWHEDNRVERELDPVAQSKRIRLIFQKADDFNRARLARGG